MPLWLEQNWWWVFPVLGIAVYVTFRVRHRGGDEPLLLRIYYALEPDSDPRRKPRAKLSRLGLVVIVIIVVVITVANFVLELND
jgi:hypothetical protein